MSEKKGSKFSGIFAPRQENEEVVEQTPVNEPTVRVEEVSPSPTQSIIQVADPAPKPKPKSKVSTPEAPSPVGRPRGKRSDKNHVQVTAYIRRSTHLDVKAALLRDQMGRDFSDLVEELMAKWLKSRT